MLIEDIIQSKINKLNTKELSSSNLELTTEEFNILDSIPSIISFKLRNEIPEDFVPTRNAITARDKVDLDPSLWNVLELCVLQNRKLSDQYKKVIPDMFRNNGYGI